MDNRPEFEKLPTNELVRFCYEAFDIIIAQRDTIQQLRSDLRDLQNKLDTDDWK